MDSESIQRCIELVGALAKPERERWVKHLLDPKGGEENLLALCEQWGIEPIVTYPSDGSRAYYSMGHTLHKLARFAVGQDVMHDADES
jgi:hypothetical protein